MKKFIVLILLSAGLSFAQNFSVEKLKGDVKVLRGSSENWETVNVGTVLSGSDLISTEENGFIQLNRNGERFILQRNSALGLNYIKKISINDLLLALAMEDVRNVPKNKNENATQNTAVYGTEESAESTDLFDSGLGIKRLNGAKQLAENGFKESSIIAAKETYRKYPNTKSLIEERLYFVKLLRDLNLNQEAMDELADLRKQNLTTEQLDKIDELLQEIKLNSVTD